MRGGYGIYYDQTRSGANGLLSYGSQGFNQSTNPVTTYQNDGATPYLHLSNPFPNGLILPPGSSLGLLNDVGYGAIGPIRDCLLRQELPTSKAGVSDSSMNCLRTMIFTVDYIGKKGTHLYYQGLNTLDILGRQVEKLSPAQIGRLVNYVSNPFRHRSSRPPTMPTAL